MVDAPKTSPARDQRQDVNGSAPSQAFVEDANLPFAQYTGHNVTSLGQKQHPFGGCDAGLWVCRSTALRIG